MDYSAVILAAGKGTRMKSQYPKVVHRVAGKPMVVHVVDAVHKAGVEHAVLVVGHGREMVQTLFAEGSADFVVQEEQLGTGHALLQARNAIKDEETILVLAGDTPLLQSETLKLLIDHHEVKGAVATVLSTAVNDPFGYGRIVRNKDGSFQKIVEEKDAIGAEKKIGEINSGMYCFQAGKAFEALQKVSTSNAQGEYYLTEILEIFTKEEQRVEICQVEAQEDVYGINDRVQLAEAQRILQDRKNRELMLNGVTIIDPSSTFIDMDVEIGRDTIIYPFTVLEGLTSIGQFCEIGPNSRISDTRIGDNVFIENSRIKEAVIGDECMIGPFAYLRPQAKLEKGVKVGDFVEIKKSIVGEGSKIPHLSYVGDATIGKKVNVGAGTITCNYDGTNKWETVLEDGAFIGSNSNLVAPVKIGKNATTGAGSTITRDVPEDALGVERAPQKIFKDWKNRKSKETGR
ncbi:MAG: bifunctional UDP-N-acetylglucosamine diphosphorylase/glucosamine-1-phosphate N-acetyltransferase GlmU [Bacillota bacterium]|nr:bifunctional UDP-N-acetylglucosamine diphosphorylase/glucosamine-1-phosphate N-acetyltransferase GlmU [Bacillota bacterium]